MTSLRALTVPAVLFALAARSADQEIEFRVAKGTTLARTLESHYELELESVEVNGEELPSEELGGLEMRMEHKQTLAITDSFEEVADGGPRRLRRTYETLDAKDTTSVQTDEMKDGDESDYESALEGLSVLFTWDDEAGEFDASFAEGSDGDSALLEGLEEDMDLRSVLPGRAVAEGDSWEVDADAFESVVDPGGDMSLVDPDADEPLDEEQEEALRDNIEGEITATYRGTRDEDGARVAVIEVAAVTSSSADGDMELEELPEGASATRRIEVEYDVEGELLWDLENGHALSLELSGRHEFRVIESLRAEMEGEEIDQSQTMAFAGDVRFSMRVERK